MKRVMICWIQNMKEPLWKIYRNPPYNNNMFLMLTSKVQIRESTKGNLKFTNLNKHLVFVLSQ